ncbi:MAG: hypothetical protein K8I30_09910, partial [Anaerolineae bacterium]|nr:hypothetical protein [Anaerolineae bacterium]
EIWVDLYEAAEITGYSVVGLRKLISRVNQKPEEERELRVRKRTSRWEIWLPDLLVYAKQSNRGPNRKRKNGT